MNQKTPEEVEQAKHLSRDFRDAIVRAKVRPREAVDALAHTLGMLLIQVSASEEQLAAYLNNMRDAAVQGWRERQQPPGRGS